jgi:hypothetical protein
VTAVRGDQEATVSFTPGSDGGREFIRHSVLVYRGATLQRVVDVGLSTNPTITGLTNGLAYRFRVRSTNSIGIGALSAFSNTVTPATVPGTPTIGTAASGSTTDGNVTALARWGTATNGGSAITGYRITALRIVNGSVTDTIVTNAAAAARSMQVPLPAGVYRFRVRAVNAVGEGALSPESNQVTAR